MKYDSYTLVHCKTNLPLHIPIAKVIFLQAIKIKKGTVVDVLTLWFDVDTGTFFKNENSKEKEFRKNKKSTAKAIHEFFYFTEGLPLVFHQQEHWEKVGRMFYQSGFPTSIFPVISTKNLIKRVYPHLMNHSLYDSANELDCYPLMTEEMMEFSETFILKELYEHLMFESFSDLPIKSPQLLPMASYDSYYDYRILRVVSWKRRERGKEGLYYLFVLTTKGTLYYNQMKNGWYRKDFEGSFHQKEIHERTLRFLNLQSTEELNMYDGERKTSKKRL